jgi:hypothetical protein
LWKFTEIAPLEEWSLGVKKEVEATIQLPDIRVAAER